MGHNDRNWRDGGILRLMRSLPLFIISFLGAFAVIVNVAGLDSIDWLKGRLPSLTFAAAGTIAFYLAFERFSIGRDISELKQLMSATGNSEGFRKVPTAEVSKIAARMIKDVSILRTLGTARQDLLDTNESAKLYLRETENRVRRTNPPFSYYRITSDRLRETFTSHMVLLLSSDARHKIQVELISNIEATVTYQIFDRTHVLILLDNPSSPGRRDYAVALMSSDQEIVDGFITHFDDAWSHGTPIEDVDDLRKRVTPIP